jgi:hypothetical protein
MAEYDVDVDSKILAFEGDESSVSSALGAAGELVRLKPPRFTVRVTASSETEAGKRAVEALERWAGGPGVGWRVVSASRWTG